MKRENKRSWWVQCIECEQWYHISVSTPIIATIRSIYSAAQPWNGERSNSVLLFKGKSPFYHIRKLFRASHTLSRIIN